MNLDEAYVFIFVRQDLFNWEQLVAVAHAAIEAGVDMVRNMPLAEAFTSGSRPNGHPNVIIVGLPDEQQLEAVCGNLVNLKVEFETWTDPDNHSQGRTALFTQPMTKQTRNKLHHYRPWSERNNLNPKGAG